MTVELQDKLYTSTQVAEILGVSLRTLYRYMEDGRIQSMRTASGRHRFTKDQILEFLNAGNNYQQMNPQGQNGQQMYGQSQPQNYVGYQNQGQANTPYSQFNQSNQNQFSNQRQSNAAGAFDQGGPKTNDFGNSQMQGSNQNQQFSNQPVVNQPGNYNDSFGQPTGFTPTQPAVTQANVKEDILSTKPSYSFDDSDDEDDFTGLPSKTYPAYQEPVVKAPENSDFGQKGYPTYSQTPASNAYGQNQYATPSQQSSATTFGQKVEQEPELKYSSPVQQEQKPYEDLASDVSSKIKYYKSDYTDLIELAKKVKETSGAKDLEYAFTLYAGLSLHFLINPFTILHFYVNPEDMGIWTSELRLAPAQRKEDSNIGIIINTDIIFVPTKEIGGFKLVEDKVLLNDLSTNGEDDLYRKFREHLTTAV